MAENGAAIRAGDEAAGWVEPQGREGGPAGAGRHHRTVGRGNPGRGRGNAGRGRRAGASDRSGGDEPKGPDAMSGGALPGARRPRSCKDSFPKVGPNEQWGGSQLLNRDISLPQVARSVTAGYPIWTTLAPTPPAGRIDGRPFIPRLGSRVSRKVGTEPRHRPARNSKRQGTDHTLGDGRREDEQWRRSQAVSSTNPTVIADRAQILGQSSRTPLPPGGRGREGRAADGCGEWRISLDRWNGRRPDQVHDRAGGAATATSRYRQHDRSENVDP